ncbi:MAG: 4-hydroxybenzoate octaprenyltransferase [Methylocystis sp.]|nr:4-hydroxybenzoate octaprenyltransferase [Methylocystis sp.]MBI3275047.1 4-hydroxybenzoate octaprenyltransferase [Methylocystis sp.]
MSAAGKDHDAAASELLPDAVGGHPLWRFAPAALRPFVQLARLDRPVGWWLLLLPCWQSNALAAAAQGKSPDFVQLTLFFVGAVAMRGAGSTYNDIIDRDIDAQVERTRGRPLASGRVSLRAAALFLAAQCAIGLAVLLSFNLFTILAGFASLSLVLVYPFAKRFTSWPQAVLGLAFAYGALLGWTAQTGSFAAPAALLYLAAVFWTIGFDTIYALQDVRDDANAGVRSTARLFGKRVRLGVCALYCCAAAFAELALIAAHQGIFAQAGVLAFAAHLAWQTRRLRENCAPALALALFRSNRDAGLLLFAGFFAQSLA